MENKISAMSECEFLERYPQFGVIDIEQFMEDAGYKKWEIEYVMKMIHLVRDIRRD